MGNALSSFLRHNALYTHTTEGWGVGEHDVCNTMSCVTTVTYRQLTLGQDYSTEYEYTYSTIGSGFSSAAMSRIRFASRWIICLVEVNTDFNP